MSDVKDLLLALNIEADNFNTHYVLRYDYSFNDKKKCPYSSVLVLKFVNKKLNNNTKVFNETGAIEYICNEMKKYSHI